jgi:hypothetical protein
VLRATGIGYLPQEKEFNYSGDGFVVVDFMLLKVSSYC